MSPNVRRKKSMSGAIVALLAGMALGCETSVLEPLKDRADLAAAAAGNYSAWSVAANIEVAPPGADADVNTEALEGCPFISRDGKSFYIASNRPGGFGGLDIWVSTRASMHDAWGEPVNVGKPVNSGVDDFCPTIARDGHTFYFVSRRQEGALGEDFCGGADIYVTRLRDERGFEEPKNVGCQVNSPDDEFSPFPLPERGSGTVLYYSRKPGPGPGDLYMSRSRGGVFGPGELVPGVNSPDDDGQPNLRRDGLELFFYSNRDDGDAQGGNDIYVSTRSSTSAPWSAPVNLGSAVNSNASETRPSLSWDGTTLYFGSNRAESEAASSDIYVSMRARLLGP
jgi:hypothetical protein